MSFQFEAPSAEELKARGLNPDGTPIEVEKVAEGASAPKAAPKKTAKKEK